MLRNPVWSILIVLSLAAGASAAGGAAANSGPVAGATGSAGAAALSGRPHTVEDFEEGWRPDRWKAWNGPEFPGATAQFDRSRETGHDSEWGGRLSFDFTGGGAYVAAEVPLDKATTPDATAVRLWLRRPRGNTLAFRCMDRTGQWFQRPFRIPDGKWVDVVIPLADWIGHWDGANDGEFHGPPARLSFIIENSGPARGNLDFDDIRLVEGKPWDGYGTTQSDYVACRFAPEEGWVSWAGGPTAATTQIEGRKWRYDFTGGDRSLTISPRDITLIGTPRSIRVRVKGNAAGHPVELHVYTHFMNFKRVLGEFKGPGVHEVTVPAPPAEGWTWEGGENDGQLHSPLRLGALTILAGPKKDVGEIELLEIGVSSECPPQRSCLVHAELREEPTRLRFVGVVRNLADKPVEGTVDWVIRDWSGHAVAGPGQRKVTIPAHAVPVEVGLPMPEGDSPFLEAEYRVDAPGLVVMPAQAYYTAPVEPQGTNDIKPESPFGMGIYLYRYPADERGRQEMERAAELAQGIGAKWSREDFLWDRIEPEPGRFEWDFYDNMVRTAKSHGIAIYGMLAYWSPWIEKQKQQYTPEGIEAYCRFVRAVVERYKDDVQYWEIWNEPNIFFWQGPKELYARMLTRAYATIKEANPDAQVLGCSVAGVDGVFLRLMTELKAPYDILTVHPYRHHMADQWFMNEMGVAQQLTTTPEQPPRPIWITEIGWSTHAYHNSLEGWFAVTSQRQQAEYMARVFVDSLAAGVRNVSWYNFRNDGDDPYYFEHNMGVMTHDFRPRPAYRTFATLTRTLEGRSQVTKVDLGPGVFAYRFAEPGGVNPVMALWSLDQDRTIELPAGSPVQVTDLTGSVSTIKPQSGKARVCLPFQVPMFLTPPAPLTQPAGTQSNR